jgi:hypothetical protein
MSDSTVYEFKKDGRMYRKTIYLNREELDALERTADALGVSRTRIVRAALRTVLLGARWNP